MSQEQIVADFTTLATTDAALLVTSLLAYHQQLSTLLFEIATLDDAHREEIRIVSRADLLRLRQRLESLVVTVRLATAAPDI